MKKSKAEELINALIKELRQIVEHKLREIELLADEHGIVVLFTGLPPFDDYGNSGYYFPVDEKGFPWYESSLRNEYYPLEGHGALEGWLSSNAGC